MSSLQKSNRIQKLNKSTKRNKTNLYDSDEIDQEDILYKGKKLNKKNLKKLREDKLYIDTN